MSMIVALPLRCFFVYLARWMLERVGFGTLGPIAGTQPYE